MQSSACAVVHYTSIDGDYPCDTFFPAIDSSQFRLWSASAPQRAPTGDRYSFLCYTRAGSVKPIKLPPAVASRHEEHQVRLMCLQATRPV